MTTRPDTPRDASNPGVAGGAPKVVLQRLLAAERRRVWQAFTDPGLIGRWMFPTVYVGCEVDVDPRVGGRFCLVMLNEDGERFEHSGEYVEVVPERRLVFTWSVVDCPSTRVTVELDAVGEATRLTLTHEFLTEDYRERYAQGWPGVFDRLDALLAAP